MRLSEPQTPGCMCYTDLREWPLCVCSAQPRLLSREERPSVLLPNGSPQGGLGLRQRGRRFRNLGQSLDGGIFMELAGCPNGACPEPQLHRALRRPGHRVWGGPVLPDLLPSFRGPGCFIRTVYLPGPRLQLYRGLILFQAGPRKSSVIRESPPPTAWASFSHWART